MGTKFPAGLRIRWSRVFSIETLVAGMLVAMLAGLVADWVGDIKATQTQVRRNGERLSRVEANMETLTNDVSSLKETQAKHSEILTQIRARQAAMEVSPAAMQTEIKATQTEIKASQAAMQSTQAAMQSTQAEIKSTQAEIKATQAEIKATQAEQGETLSDLKVAIARIEVLLLEGR